VLVDGVINGATAVRSLDAPLLSAEPGRIVGLVGPAGFGLTRLGLSMLAPPSGMGPVAAIDVRGWLSPEAAWEVGITPERLVVVRCDDRSLWPQVVAALVEGLAAVYAEVPAGIGETTLRRLGALTRSRGAALLLRPVRGGLPSGLAHLHLDARDVAWAGVERGHGRLTRRRLSLLARGRGTRGIERMIEVTDDGTHALRVVSGLATAPAGRAAG
jgi:hypothetical protein